MNEIVNIEGTNVFTTHAVVELTAFRRQHGTSPIPLPFETATRMVDGEQVIDLTNADQIKTDVLEMLRAGQMVGIDADPTADLTGFMATAFPANGEQPNRVVLRPEAKFGADDDYKPDVLCRKCVKRELLTPAEKSVGVCGPCQNPVYRHRG
jgi:hypothetical protein